MKLDDGLRAGARLGGYELQHVLGEGGMGVVWRARDPLLDRAIALKVLKHAQVGAAMRTRLLREAQAMAQIKHPNVLTVHRVGTDGDRDYIVMELVEGGPLDHWLAFGPPEPEVLQALLAAGRGLAAAHAAGLVHRDFKPNNVLRSREGRVMVTDFGLARALGDDPDEPAGRGPDNVLDARLTRTGALIGTPAYMAPEQFAGAEPDPRTDQFAFCVTAWQALTGARPFHGRTLEELRAAASKGVTTVIAELPRPLRAVLTRGLDPDPTKRWPDLATLLHELEHASRPRRTRRLVIAGAATALAVTAVLAALTRSPPAPRCEPAAWDGALPTQPWLAATLADHRRRWTASYEQTCKTPSPRRACLDAVRSRLELTSALARDPAASSALDPALYLVPPESCATRAPVPAALPGDPQVVATLARATVLPARELEATGSLGPLLAVIAGSRDLREGERARGRARLERALASPDPRLLAFARLGLLAASLDELAHPELPAKPEALPEEIARALTYARAAVKAAGEEPVLAGLLALSEARTLASLVERTRKVTLGEARARAGEARALFEVAGDPRRVAEAALVIAELELREPARLGEAEFAARSAIEALARAQLPEEPRLAQVLAQVSFARGDLAAAHRWFDRGGEPRPVTGEPITGVVLGLDGLPVMNAVVVAWVGELHGDAARLVTDRRDLDGELVETGAEGRFRLHQRAGAVVMAELPGGSARSAPVALAPGLTLRLAATGEVAGRIETTATSGVEAYARLDLGDAQWSVHAPIGTAGAFQLGNLPPRSYQLGTIGLAGTATRRIFGGAVTITPGTTHPHALAWPAGRMLDVVVRGTVEPGARAWLVDAETARHERQRRPFEVRATAAFDGIASPLVPIGVRITEAGRAVYTPGAHHALFIGDYQAIAACVAPSARPDAALTCTPVEPGAGAVVVELP